MSELTVRGGKLTVKRTARFFFLRDAGADIDSLWFVLHGYGEDAAFFLEQFQCIMRPGRVVVAPEGLSRFYQRGMEGEVGASWMTSEAREWEIKDYVSYLDQLYRHVLQRFGLEKAAVKLLGFSQGAATAARWAVLGEALMADDLILWAGGWPPDLPLSRSEKEAPEWRLTLVHGTDDPYIEAREVQDLQQKLETANRDFATYRFKGGHRLDDALLQQLADA